MFREMENILTKAKQKGFGGKKILKNIYVYEPVSCVYCQL